VSSVGAIDIKCGIRLGIAQRLRLRQHVVKRAAFGELISVRIKLPVPLIMPATSAYHIVGRHRFPQRFDNRYATRNCGLKSESARPQTDSAERKQFITMLSNQRLVCRDNVFALLNRQFDQIISNRDVPPISSTSTSTSGSRATSITSRLTRASP
jgi:hypothetical protein